MRSVRIVRRPSPIALLIVVAIAGFAFWFLFDVGYIWIIMVSGLIAALPKPKRGKRGW